MRVRVRYGIYRWGAGADAGAVPRCKGAGAGAGAAPRKIYRAGAGAGTVLKVGPHVRV